jgi:hypothetical protein
MRPVAALAGLAFLLALSAAPASAHGRAVVPVTIEGGQGTSLGARPMVRVRVGRSRALPVLLDTGSSGLRVYAPAVDTSPGHGVTVGSQRDSITYAGGSRLTGPVASARVRIGGHATATRVPFTLVTSAGCAPAKPACPTAGGIDAAIASGHYGVLGIGMAADPQGVISPIFGMPGRQRRTWSLHLRGKTGALVLGARVPAGRRVAATLPLVARGSSGNARFWADSRVRVCVGVGTVASCVPSLFDSGTFQTQLWGEPLASAPVTPGTPVTVATPGAASPFWSFTAGTTKSKDTVTVHAGQPFVNFGVPAYYAFTVTYDDLAGTVTLSRRR